MGLNDYPQPGQNSAESEAQSWFSQTEGQFAPAQPSQPGKKKPIITAMLVVACILLAAGLLVTKLSAITTCLTPNDYELLTGQRPDPQLSPQTFYTSSIAYIDGTTIYLPAESKQNDTEIAKIAAFFTRHYDAKKSVIVTINSEYATQEQYTTANDRVEILRTKLIQAGVPESVIVTVNPTELHPPTDVGEEYDTPTKSLAYINVASPSTCK